MCLANVTTCWHQKNRFCFWVLLLLHLPLTLIRPSSTDLIQWHGRNYHRKRKVDVCFFPTHPHPPPLFFVLFVWFGFFGVTVSLNQGISGSAGDLAVVISTCGVKPGLRERVPRWFGEAGEPVELYMRILNAYRGGGFFQRKINLERILKILNHLLMIAGAL